VPVGHHPYGHYGDNLLECRWQWVTSEIGLRGNGFAIKYQDRLHQQAFRKFLRQFSQQGADTLTIVPLPGKKSGNARVCRRVGLISDRGGLAPTPRNTPGV
jgi:dGTP triphosphohydrolase